MKGYHPPGEYRTTTGPDWERENEIRKVLYSLIRYCDHSELDENDAELWWLVLIQRNARSFPSSELLHIKSCGVVLCRGMTVSKYDRQVI
jgi:hypothetical protein